MAGIRLPNGVDFDSAYPRNVSGRIFDLSGIRTAETTDCFDRYENMRTGNYGPTTGFRARDGVDLRQRLDTQTGTPLGFNYNTTSGDVPLEGAAWGTAYATLRTDGQIVMNGTWWAGQTLPWFSNPSAGIGNMVYINVQRASTPAQSSWGGVFDTWIPLSSDRTYQFNRLAPANGSAVSSLVVYFSWATDWGTVIKTGTLNFSASGRNR